MVVMWEASNEALLAGFVTGDPDAAAAFIRRFQRRVYGLARSIVSDPSLAEDVSQETFVRAWRHGAAYDARRGSVPTWLLTITRNLAIDAVRLRRPQPVDPEAITRLGWEATGPGASPSETAEGHDDESRLRAAIRLLPEEQRRALVLAAIGGRTAKEISECEHIPLGTAKTRIRSGMIKLRASLAGEREAEAE
jgi:RNA polymerase sigma-70 factor (ECF subfamily)